MFTENALATILLCSYIRAKEGGYKPYTALKWSNLVAKIVNSDLKEPAALLYLSKDEISEKLNIDFNEADRIKHLLSRGANMALYLEDLERKGIHVVTRSDKHYPKRLKSILKKNAPALLYYCGDISLANHKGIAIVGSRNIDNVGENFAIDLATKATKEGFAIFSGGARGIDTISEETAIKNGGIVISVIADSLIKKIKRKDIRDKVVMGKLLLMSANNPDVSFTAGGAMNRNKYVYALSRGTFIVASDYNKGGTWAGATENLKHEWVKTFVYKSDNYQGNMALVQKGAVPIDDLQDIAITDLTDMPIDKPEQLNIFEANNNSRNLTEQNELNNESMVNDNNKLNFDLYSIVIDVIAQYLQEPKTLDDISSTLIINKKQASVWLQRAIQENKVKKLNKPVRYISENKV